MYKYFISFTSVDNNAIERGNMQFEPYWAMRTV